MMGTYSHRWCLVVALLVAWNTQSVVGSTRAKFLSHSGRGEQFPGQRSRTSPWTVQERLSRSLRRHVDFQNLTWSHMGSSPSDEIARHIPNTMTLRHAHVIHQHALDAIHAVQRSWGYAMATPPPNPNPNVRVERPPLSSSPMLFSPVDYGADPTGNMDSTAAFHALLHDFLAVSPSRTMAANITNLGGAIIDLQGGQYLISQPIIIPPFYGNAHLKDGTLQASLHFPSDRWLVEIGNVDTCQPVKPDDHHTPDPQYSCNEFIDLTNILLDANFVAAGGVRISRVMGTTLTEVFVTGFRNVGILISHGHEVMVTNAWLAECYWSNNQWCFQRRSESVGIRIDGMDHYITNTIVFDFARIGVEILEPANILVGVHTWNGGRNGIVVGTRDTQAHSVRLIGCYLDFQTLDIWDPWQIVVESTFFYYGHVVLHAGKQSTVDGLTMRFNYYNTNQSVVLDGTFQRIKSISIQDEGGDSPKTTKASQRLELSNASAWEFDFGDQLLFPTIDFIQYSMASNRIVSHVATPPNGTRVAIVTAEPVDAIVYVTVEQGNSFTQT